VGLFKIRDTPQHVGFLTVSVEGTMGLLHAYAPARRVVEHRFDSYWQHRLFKVFRWPLLS
jgi:hypothetical protein